MNRRNWSVWRVVMVAAAAAAFGHPTGAVWAQAGDEGGPRPEAREGKREHAERGDRERAPEARRGDRDVERLQDRRQRMEEQLELRLSRLGLEPAQKEAVKRAVQQKMAINQRLAESLHTLMTAVRQKDGGGEKAAAALQEYVSALNQARQQRQEIDRGLTASLKLAENPQIHAALLMSGILENGIGGLSRMRPPAPPRAPAAKRPPRRERDGQGAEKRRGPRDRGDRENAPEAREKRRAPAEG